MTENTKRKTPQMLQLLEEHPPEKPGDPTTMAVTSTQLLTHRKSAQIVKEALNCSEKEQWQAEMQEEMDSIYTNGV